MKIKEIKKRKEILMANGWTFEPDTIEVKEETIKSYHEDACQSFKTRIEKDFPALFEVTLEVGKWYRKHNSLLVWNNKEKTYGFFNGTFHSRWSFDALFDRVPATDEEVSTALIAEAKKRGYKSGNHKSLSGYTCVNNTKNYYFLDGQSLWIGEIGNCNLIFRDGLWAEIIKEESVYEWLYVYYSTYREEYLVTSCHYKSKKEFLKAMPNLKPLYKIKESKRIRE
jgi:hypothetical protein